MIHLYCGDGKGKTTCAFGLALRAAGRGREVIVAQFLKSGDSGERVALEHVPGVTLLPVPPSVKFTFAMNELERAAAAVEASALLSEARSTLPPGGVVVLDEICAAVSTGMVRLEAVTEFLDRLPEGTEAILTGRDPAPELLDRADYITEMRKLRHPFDKGIPARKGVEW